MRAHPTRISVVAMALLAATACSKAGPSGPNCTVALTGTPWTPNVPGASSSNHDPSVTVTSAFSQHTAPLIGLQQPVTDAELVAVPIQVTQSPGAFGSLTLQATGTSMPTGLVGSAT